MELNNYTNRITIENVTYKTGGNILFSNDESSYIRAESKMLDKMDEALQNGILKNGMQTFFEKFSGKFTT